MRNRTQSLALLAPLLLAGQISVTAANPFSVIHEFDGKNGNGPAASFLVVDGLLYGTTGEGGQHNGGTLFAMDPVSGKTTVLHDFGKRNDGFLPMGSLIEIGGTLYGTTFDGGTTYPGTVYSFDPQTDQESVIWSFGDNKKDGHFPNGAVTELRGKLYGTTSEGGTSDVGTVFSLDPVTGREKVLHAFTTDGEDGNIPLAGLTAVNGVLYGTTAYGGNSSCTGYQVTGCGVVFAITPDGRETVLYSFKNNSSDGNFPEASLMVWHGRLYGTTEDGGKHGNGTIFSFDPDTGKEKVLYSFASSRKDGQYPAAPLIESDGTFYGTTVWGGRFGVGSVFSFDPVTGAEAITSVHQGARVLAGVVAWRGALYGATSYGGKPGKGKYLCSKGRGCGLAFSVRLRGSSMQRIRSVQ